MPRERRENRGPSAAQANRRALVAAATEVFAQGGLGAPLNAVAKRAGVGQGSLYRHFPDRISLALAVFEGNVAEVEAVAADPDCGLDELLALLTDQAVESAAFVDVVTAAADDPRLAAVVDRVRAALGTVLGRDAAAAGWQGREDDLLLAVGMVAAVVARTPQARRETAARAWGLLRCALDGGGSAR